MPARFLGPESLMGKLSTKHTQDPHEALKTDQCWSFYVLGSASTFRNWFLNVEDEHESFGMLEHASRA